MEDNLDKIEQDFKKKEEPKQKMKKSGRSVFKIKEIISKKAEKGEEKKDGDPL